MKTTVLTVIIQFLSLLFFCIYMFFSFLLFQTVNSVVRSYLRVSKSDVPCKTWKSQVSETDISRLSVSFLSMNKFCDIDSGGEENSQNEIDVGGGYKSQDEVEDWLSKCHIFLKMFDRVFYHMFPVISVSRILFNIFTREVA